QITGLAISIGSVFNGASITGQDFGYPGIGRLLVDAVHAAHYLLVLSIASISITAVSAAVLLIDIIYSLIDPLVKGTSLFRLSTNSCATMASSPSASASWRSSSPFPSPPSSRPIRPSTSM